MTVSTARLTAGLRLCGATAGLFERVFKGASAGYDFVCESFVCVIVLSDFAVAALLSHDCTIVLPVTPERYSLSMIFRIDAVPTLWGYLP
jgi:hypothetical protein